MRIEQYAAGEVAVNANVSKSLITACGGDVDCACWACLDELRAERARRGWRDEYYGLPPTKGGNRGI
jgi:hypothetical protein